MEEKDQERKKKEIRKTLWLKTIFKKSCYVFPIGNFQNFLTHKLLKNVGEARDGSSCPSVVNHKKFSSDFINSCCFFWEAGTRTRKLKSSVLYLSFPIGKLMF